MTTASADLQPHTYRVRAPTDDDAPAIVELIAACDRKQYGVADPYTPEDIFGDWRRLTLETDAWVITAEQDDRVVGYATLIDHGHGRFDADGYVHPDVQGQGVGALLVRLTEARARELAADAPNDTRVILNNAVILSDDAARHLLEAHDYSLVRGFWRMAIDLLELPLAPQWPSGIAVCAFVPGQDERPTFDATEEAFQDHWGHLPGDFEKWVDQTRRDDFDPSLWFLALDGDQIAGAALCRYNLGMGWVGTLAVRRPWRRSGLGMALLRQAFVEFYRRGQRRVGLGVDAQSLTGATRLYERAGMRVTMHVAVYQKELRPSPDL
ncbi:MAG: GNAT family N-acetyltransferase, partial [Ktedonobacterales bacterium]